MADQKVTELTELVSAATEDLLYVEDDPAGTPLSRKVTLATLASLLTPEVNQETVHGRLTLESGVPVPISNQAFKTTLYFTPYKGDKISLYDGSNWQTITFAEKSLSMSGWTTNSNFDIFGYLSGGELVLESLIWTSDIVRATELTTQDGVLVKTGAVTRRYLGTIRTHIEGQTDDSEDERFIWNYYNRVVRWFRQNDTTSHSYTTATVRSWNNDNNVRIAFVVGVQEDSVVLALRAGIKTSAVGTRYVSLGIDSTSTDDEKSRCRYYPNNSDDLVDVSSHHAFHTGEFYAGYHYVQPVELGATGSTFDSFYLSGFILG